MEVCVCVSVVYVSVMHVQCVCRSTHHVHLEARGGHRIFRSINLCLIPLSQGLLLKPELG